MAEKVIRSGVGVAVLTFKNSRRAKETADRIEAELQQALDEGIDPEDAAALHPRLRRAALYYEEAP
jgi:hypothetical protein